jgi:hypothetical protein
MKHPIYIKYFLIGIALAMASIANATNWTGGVDDYWCNSANWSAGTPGSNDDVIIPSGSTVVIDCNVSIKSLEVDGTLTINSSKTLSVDQDFDIGEDDNSATVVNDGTIIMGASDFKVKGDGTTSLPASPQVGPFFTNNGIFETDGKISIGNNNGGGVFTNAGTVTATSTSKEVHIDGTLINSGLFSMSGKLKMHGAHVSGGGTIEVPLVEFDDNNDRKGTFIDQSIEGIGEDSCDSSGAGTDFRSKSEGNNIQISFEEFIDVHGLNPDGSDYYVDPDKFYVCGINANGSGLPVDLISFEGSLDMDQVILEWVTLSELNNDFFEIERSSDGLNFYSIGKVMGNGTTSDRHVYQYIDINISGALSYYYRLSQKDFDGAVEYFSTIFVPLGNRELTQFMIYPNPVTSDRIALPEIFNNKEFIVVNKSGIIKISNKVRNREINIKRLIPGMYILIIQSGANVKFYVR